MMKQLSAPLERSGNRLLGVLTAGAFGDLRPHLQRIALSPGRTLHKAHAPIDHVYFPEGGIISLVNALKDGVTVEVALFGREGMTGTMALSGAAGSPLQTVVQIPGSAWRLPTAILLETIRRHPDFDAALRRFVHAMLAQVVQAAACNGRHTVEQRLARWLLTAHDRIDGDELPLKHEAIALLLGIRRPGVSAAISRFKSAGLVATRHGQVVLRDRPGLEAAACECYATVAEQSRALFT